MQVDSERGPMFQYDDIYSFHWTTFCSDARLDDEEYTMLVSKVRTRNRPPLTAESVVSFLILISYFLISYFNIL